MDEARRRLSSGPQDLRDLRGILAQVHRPDGRDRCGPPHQAEVRRVATLDEATWNNTHLIKGNAAEEVAKLKARDGGEIQVHGSGNFLQTLLARDLIDTLGIWQFPVVIGTGKRLFGEGTIPLAFQLVETRQTAPGAVLHVYERAGRLKYGEVEVGQEAVIMDSDTADR